MSELVMRLRCKEEWDGSGQIDTWRVERWGVDDMHFLSLPVMQPNNTIG